MSTATTFSTADPLTRQPLGERPVYATGMLLDAQDFLDEQTYHRSQLARALGAVAGSGTLAGLRVEHRPAVETGPDAGPEEIQVNAGLAVDRLGRLIELPRAGLPAPAALVGRRGRAQQPAAGRTTHRRAASRLIPGVPRPGVCQVCVPARAVVANVFLRFVACPRGLHTGFSQRPVSTR